MAVNRKRAVDREWIEIEDEPEWSPYGADTFSFDDPVNGVSLFAGRQADRLTVVMEIRGPGYTARTDAAMPLSDAMELASFIRRACRKDEPDTEGFAVADSEEHDADRKHDIMEARE